MKDFIFHTTLIISYLFIVGFILSQKDTRSYSPFVTKVFIGTGTGLMGIVLMYFSIQITSSVILDLRHLFMIMAALFGGPISSMLASVIIASGRILLFGVNEASIVAASNALLLGAIFGVISTIRFNLQMKGFLMNLVALFSTLIAFIYLTNIMKALEITFFLALISIPVGFLIVSLSLYIYRYNAMIKKLKKENKMDFLTGLNNVRKFDEEMNGFKSHRLSNGERLSLLFIDIDHFKKVNDTYGHDAGDEVLKQLAVILRENKRPFDQAYRNGGEEFSILLHDCSLHQAKQVAERIRKAVEKHSFVLSGQTVINITISIGVAAFPETTSDIDQLVKKADEGLYKAKRSGRNKVCA
ncbi:diguanylate cyclase [Bacillus sp. FJAT-47783]|uniref:GGDEF domain-containing protein n=1 Tax=Bacillus sp. FJAT-47783 TaxID=2922712 RepID=UPI001FACD606|nr:diguanylate cyclase [Bacillus sp. FJAT-47783]